MIRQAALVTVLLSVGPSWLSAQNTEFTVNAPRADVHKAPTIASPVIGNAARGTVVTVTRELGSWVRISWPAADDGVGYLHVSTGRISNPATPTVKQGAGSTTTLIAATPSRTAAPTTGRPAPPAAAPAGQTDRARVAPQAAPAGSGSLPHLVGIGGRLGNSTLGFGFSARASVHKRLGVQLELSRYASAALPAQRQLTSIQFAPSVLFALPDRLTDYLWLRPYAGAGITMYRSTLGTGVPGVVSTDNRYGRHVFAGTALTFASAPRFALSADYGYRWHQAPFSGFDLGGPGLSVSGHWYVK